MPTFRIVTNKPVAIDSPDHLLPWGTARDNSVNLAFNKKLIRLIPVSQLRVLDLGCAGGGFVKSILAQGGFAIGVEGSDYSRVRKRAEWATIPDHLFTADITEPFWLLEEGAQNQERPLQFNVITGWEIIEHVREEQLACVCENIMRHLSTGGLVIMSVSPLEDVIKGVRLHQTVKQKEWWIAKFEELGLIHHESLCGYFGIDWIRGGFNAPGSEHLVMTKAAEKKVIDDKIRSLKLTIWERVRSKAGIGINKLFFKLFLLKAALSGKK